MIIIESDPYLLDFKSYVGFLLFTASLFIF